MRLKVHPSYCLVFAVRGKRKIGTLFSPTKGALGDFNQVQPIWVGELGINCKIAQEGVTIGSKGYVHDAYDLDDLGQELWPSYREILPAHVTAEIEKEALEGDGYISANVINEASIFAIEEPANAE